MTLHDALRRVTLTDALTDEQLDDFTSIGVTREFSPGEELFREGRPADQLWILLDGEIELTQQLGHDAVLLSVRKLASVDRGV